MDRILIQVFNSLSSCIYMNVRMNKCTYPSTQICLESRPCLMLGNLNQSQSSDTPFCCYLNTLEDAKQLDFKYGLVLYCLRERIYPLFCHFLINLHNSTLCLSYRVLCGWMTSPYSHIPGYDCMKTH